MVWPTAVTAIAAMLILGVMAIAGVPKDTIMMIAAFVPVPVLTAFVAGQVAMNAQATSSLQQQTNGHQAQMLALLGELSYKLAAAPPPPAPEPPPVQVVA